MKDKAKIFIEELDKVIISVDNHKELLSLVFLCSRTWWCYIDSYKGIKIIYSSLVPKGLIILAPSPYYKDYDKETN